MKFFKREPVSCSICFTNKGTKSITRTQKVCMVCFDRIKSDALKPLNDAIKSRKKMELRDIRKVSDEITKSLVED